MHYPRIDTTSVFDAAILCDGDFPSHDIALAVMRGCGYLCCCDRAGMEAIARGYHPDAIVGDGDSMPAAFAAQHAAIMHMEAEQDDNDQTKATRFCAARGLRRVAYLGATGKREDHTLGNISHLLDYADDFGILPTMVTDYGYLVPARGRNTFATVPGRQVSVFNVSCTQLLGSGLRWPLYAFTRLWHGTLNEALGPEFTVEGDGQYIVYITHEGKSDTRESK